ncbi:MAG: hypothetical protein R6U08_10045 [Bacillota bacterium]
MHRLQCPPEKLSGNGMKAIVEEGTNFLEAMRFYGISIPALC